MPIILPEQKTFEQTPAGSHIATCYQILDLGSQISDFANDKGERKVNHMIRLVWELPNAKMADGRPFSIGKDYNFSSNEKSNLVNDINAWRGKPFTPAEFGAFDIEKLIAKSCFLQVVEATSKKGKPYSKVNAIMALPAGQTNQSLINKPLAFSLSTFDKEIFDSIPEYWRNMIAASPEYKQLTGHEDVQNGPMPELSDDIPF
jgi:hypothetical protein